jgi:CMP-N-acetylneuraminic acid synthetase
MNIVTIIPAKGNSNRFPGKNIKPFNGKPMLAWAIMACKESKYDMAIYVSSDSKDVLAIAEFYGAKTIQRKRDVCGDDVYKQAVIRSAAGEIGNHLCDNGLDCPDIVISLQPNSPQIKGYHLDIGIDALIREDKDEIFSVDSNLMQNAAFRIMKWDYVFQKDLSTNCGVVVCDLKDIHTKEDMEEME